MGGEEEGSSQAGFVGVRRRGVLLPLGEGRLCDPGGSSPRASADRTLCVLNLQRLLRQLRTLQGKAGPHDSEASGGRFWEEEGGLLFP